MGADRWRSFFEIASFREIFNKMLPLFEKFSDVISKLVWFVKLVNFGLLLILIVVSPVVPADDVGEFLKFTTILKITVFA